jgi:lipoprotein NlpI
MCVLVNFRSAAAAALTLASALIAQAALSADPDLVGRCEYTPDPKVRAAACTALVDAGKLPAREAAYAHVFRGFAQLDLHDKAGAVRELGAAIELDPDLWPARWARAELLGDTRDYATLVADWSSVIARNPELPRPYHGLGVSLDWQGDHRRAAENLAKALELTTTDAGRTELFADRAVAFEAAHQFDKSKADYDEALRRDEKLRSARTGRGRVAFLAGDAAAAAADFAKTLEIDPHDGYAVLWLALAEGRQGRDARTSLRRHAATLDLKVWPGPIVAALLDDRLPETTAAPAEPAGWSAADRQAGATCELSFYFAEYRLQRGQRAEAEALFKKSVDTGITAYVEYNAARFELARLTRR